MRYLKMFALAAVAAGALMALVGAGSASATTLCSTTVEACPSAQRLAAGTALDFTLSGSSKTKEPGESGATIDTCTGSTIKGTLENAGSATTTPKGKVEKANLTWTGCTFTTTTTTGGTLEVHKIAGTSNGTITASGFKWTNLAFGLFTCTYETGEALDVGTLTEGKPAVLHIEAVVRSATPGCPEKTEWSATYTLTEPKETTLSVSAS